MATTTKKKNSGRSWKNERASVGKQNKAKPKTNKYSTSDKSKRDDYVNNTGVPGIPAPTGPGLRGTM